MTDEAMSPFAPAHDRRGPSRDYVPNHQEAGCVFFGRSPDTATFEDLRRFSAACGGERRRRAAAINRQPFGTAVLFSGSRSSDTSSSSTHAFHS